MTRRLTSSGLLGVTFLLAGCMATKPTATTPAPADRQTMPEVGRAAIEALTFPPLQFEPPEPEELTLSNGVTVFFLEDHSLPLVDVFAQFRGGPSVFDRADLAAATAVGSSLLLSAGTERLPPDSVDKLIEFYALAPSFGTGGTGSYASIGALSQHVDFAMELLAEMLQSPRFDRDRVETWRLRELEMVKRQQDTPGSVAVTEFNRVMFGDHPIGWIMNPDDLAPDRLTEDRLRRIHRQIYCRENMMLGITGAITRDDALAKLEAVFGDWPECPGKLTAPPLPEIRREPGVKVIHKDLNQSTVVMGLPGGILQREDPEYFAAQVANWILGGSGFSSRIMARLRTEKGLAYGASSIWGAGIRHERIFGVFTQTKTESTIAATELIREILDEARRQPPTAEEVRLAVENTVNGFVFAFQDPAAIVLRRMTYRMAGLPEDWLERYLAGIQAVTPESVHEVVQRYIDPDRMTIVIVGDTARFDAPPGALGPIIRK